MKRFLMLFAMMLLIVVSAVAQSIIDTTALKPGTADGWALNYENLLMIAYALGMIIYRIVPTNGKWDWLLWPLKILDLIIPNRAKTGLKHKI